MQFILNEANDSVQNYYTNEKVSEWLTLSCRR